MEKFGLASVLDMAAFDKGMKQYMGGIDQMTGQTNKAASGMSSAFSGIGKAFVKMLPSLSVAAAGAAAGKAMLNLGLDFDSAYDTIILKTGATGAALEGLQSTLHNVMTAVPTDAGTAAKAISDLNVRLGLTGAELEGLAAPLLEASRMLGGDVSSTAQQFTRVMGDWGVPVEEASTALDKFFKAGQLTGVGMDSLMMKVVAFGSPLRLMGFELDQAIAMFAKWEKEGVNAELVMGSLRIAAGKFARDNVPLQEGLQNTITSIQGMESASEALALGMEVFGARAGPDMVAAIREGRFATDDLVAALQNSDGAIMDTAAETADFAEEFQKLKNEVNIALAPIGIALVDALTNVVKIIAPLVSRYLPAASDEIKNVGEAAKLSSSDIRDITDGLGKAIDTISGFIGTVGDIQTALAWVNPFGAAVKTASGDAESLGRVVERVRGLTQGTWAEAGFEQTVAFWEGAIGRVTSTADSLATGIEGALATASTTVGGWLGNVAASTEQAGQRLTMFALNSIDAANRIAVNLNIHGDEAVAMMAEMEAQMRIAAMQTNQAMGEAFQADAVQSAMMNIYNVVAAHSDNMLKVQADFQKRAEDMQFNHNLDRARAEQAYLNERAALLAAGRIEDANNLDQKFSTEQATSEANYNIQQQLQERALIQQEIQQVQSYIAQLQMQRDAVIESLKLAILKAQEEGKIDQATAQAAIEIAMAQASEKLRAEYEYATQSLALAQDWATGQIDARKMVMESIKALQDAEANATAALDSLQARLSNYKITLPPLPALDMRQIATPSVSRDLDKAAREVSEPATKTISQVVEDINKGIAAGKEALEELLGFEMPEGVEKGLERFGQFIAKATSAMYAAIEPRKVELDAIKDLLQPVQQVFQIFSAVGQLAKAEEAKLPDIDQWSEALYMALSNTIDILHALDMEYEKEGIDAAAGVSESIGKILSLLSFDPSKVADAKVPTGEQWNAYFWALRKMGGTLFNLIRDTSLDIAETVKEAGVVAEDIAKLFSLLAFDPSKIATVKMPKYSQWEAYFKALRHMGGTIYNLIRDTSLDIADSVKKAGDVAESIEKLFGLVTIDFSGITDAKLPTWSQWSAYFQALSKIGGRIYDHIMRTSIDLAPSIAAAAEVSADIKTLFDLVGVDFSKIIDSPKITDAQLGAWGDSMIATVTEVARAVTAIETQIGDAALDAAVNAASRVAELASAAASISGSLTSVWEEGGIDVGMLAEIYTQMRQTVNAVQQLGEGSLLPPGFEVRTYSPPGDPAPGVAAQLTTVRIIGEFSVNGVEVADFAQDYELGSEIDIKLGTQAGRF